MRIARPCAWTAAMFFVLALAAATFAQTGAATTYIVTIPEPEHHWLQVDATFREVAAGPLRLRMSRASPGRYAVHEFAKNVFAIEAFDGGGQKLRTVRVGADEWEVAGHDGVVRVVYRVFGDHADGTYLAVDPTHAHVNMPATFIWAEGFESRSIRVTFTPPSASNWSAATQLFPTGDPLTFTAPNLQYFFDSPTELAALVTSAFAVAGPDGRTAQFRIAAHTEAPQADVDALAALVARLVAEQAAVYGALPAFEPGAYTFILDYVPWADADAMEHRNSTMVSDPGASLATPAGRLAALDSISHEFFHVWNVERIRPADLEPFDFTQSNVSCCLWLAEGFTQYYGPLLRHRAGLSDTLPVGAAISVITGSGRAVRSAVEMSEHAVFADAGVANDADDRSRSFISYYTYGAAIALGLDLTIREKSSNRLGLDDFMRRLWERYGAAPAPAPGLVARPYTMGDLRRELGDLLDDAGFADDFFDRYVEGREVLDYRHLLGLAGYHLQPVAPNRGWLGDFAVQETTAGLRIGIGRSSVVPFNTPAYAAGLDSGDVVVSIDGAPATRAAWNEARRRAPGTRLVLVVERRDGARMSTTVTLEADPALTIVPAETLGDLSTAQRTFRTAWLRSRAN